MITIYSGIFNEERHLQETIESVLNQSFTNFQFIISDNHSTDSTPDIIKKYMVKDSRILRFSPKKHCPSLEHGSFILNELLPTFKNKYSIHIGGHDLWSDNYLENLFKRAESDPDVAVVYGDTYDLDYEKNSILGKYEDHVVVSNIAKPLIPHVMLLSLQVNALAFGLTSEEKRRKASWRHKCVGADHFYVTELALQGKILHEPSAQFFLRRSKDHGSLSAYAKRHLNSRAHDSSHPHRDFFQQLEWALYLVDLAVSEPTYSFYQQAPIKNMLKISLLNGYIMRYLPNLNIPNENGIHTFLESPEMSSLYDVNSASVKFVEELIAANNAQAPGVIS